VAVIGRKSMVGLVAGLALAAVLGWAWHDGGEVPLSPHSTPAMLPGLGR
jgi:hypothetical protein